MQRGVRQQQKKQTGKQNSKKTEADRKAGTAKTEADREAGTAKTEADRGAGTAKTEADREAGTAKTEADREAGTAKTEADRGNKNRDRQRLQRISIFPFYENSKLYETYHNCAKKNYFSLNFVLVFLIVVNEFCQKLLSWPFFRSQIPESLLHGPPPSVSSVQQCIGYPRHNYASQCSLK
jgi:hypothetical protein